MNAFASIDIGTNTVRLLILETGSNGKLREIGAARRITRLGEGMDTARRLLDTRMAATIEALKEFQSILSRHGAPPLRAVATSAVREAANGPDFVQRVRRETGIAVEIISWEEEARLTLEGVFWKIDPGGRSVLTFDIGGGSTEYIASRGRRMQAAEGTLLGTVRLTERFLTRHPVIEAEYRALEQHLRSELTRIRPRLCDEAPEMLIGTAGTVTTLAALDQNLVPYDPEQVHGSTLSLDRIEALQADLKRRSIAERLELEALEPGREDLIIAGAALVLETMKSFGCRTLTVSEYGIREGIVLRAAQGTRQSP